MATTKYVDINGLSRFKSKLEAEIPTKTSDLTNDSGFLTSHQDISGKEDNTNKVTSLSNSSTDTQYPSAKCVYDLVGDVGSLLDTINGEVI